MHYVVTWTIDIGADSAEEAARKALEIHRDPHSIATVFDVGWQDAKTDLPKLRQIDLSKPR